MDLPTIPEMRKDYSIIVKDLENLIECFASKGDLSQEEYLSQFTPIVIGLSRLETKMNDFAAINCVDHPNSKLNKKYFKAFKEVWKILKKLRLDTSKIERKYLETKFNKYFSWEHVYKTTNMRNDILAHLKNVLKDLTKLQNKI